MAEIASLVLFSGHLEQTAAFYRTVGLQLHDEDHGDGPRHLAADIGGLHFAIYAAGSSGAALHDGGSRAARSLAFTSPRSMTPSPPWPEAAHRS